MRITKNSLLVRMIFYNDIVVILTSFTIALVLIFLAFQVIESKIIESAKDKITIIGRNYDAELLNAKYEINQTLRITQKGNLSYSDYANLVKKRLIQKNKKFYENSVLDIVHENGRLLGGSGGKFKTIDFTGIKEKHFTYFFKNEDRLYSRIFIEDRVNNQIAYVILTHKISKSGLNNLKKSVGLRQKDKVFLEMDKTDEISNDKVFNSNPYYFHKKGKIDGETYYTVFTSIGNYENKKIGTMGVSIYYQDIENKKITISLVVFIVVLIFVTVSTTISARLFTKLLQPFKRIVEAAEEIGKGNYKISVNPEGVDEVRILFRAFNKMALDILRTEMENEKKTKKLLVTLKRISVIQKILMNLQFEDKIEVTVKNIMLALTSELGLEYSRAMYFRYSRELDKMVGEFSIVNNKIKREFLSSNKNILGFRFQIEELNNLIKLIKIPFKSENIVAKSLIEKRILYYNDKGYKYDFGNEVFKSLGIDKFLIIPIYSKNRDYGCIVVDYFGKDNKISEEEVELLGLLLLNVSLRINNKSLEYKKLEKERTLTIEKIADKFNKSDFSSEKMLKYIKQIEEYTNLTSGKKLELLGVEDIINQAISLLDTELKNNDINVSIFVNYSGKIRGNKKRLIKAICEIVKNSIQSLKMNEDVKKINVVVTKEKNTNKVIINIIDNGCGIDESVINHVFEPFVSDEEKGLGLGLTIVKQIIKEHHGVIKCFSNKDSGTTIKIILNVSREEII